jgi:hypothetical protein
MKIRQISIIKPTVTAVLGFLLTTHLAGNATAHPVVVTDVTDWGTTPVEVVNVNDPLLNYYSGVYAGINTLKVTDGSSVTINNGFCIDPFHWSASGPTSGYNTVPLSDAPKAPGEMTATVALDIEKLWAEYYSPTMSDGSAAALQIAIWDLVSSNAVANGQITPSDAFTVTSYDYGAETDIASLATYQGPAANLIALTGPGQDYVIQNTPDGGPTLLMLMVTAGALFMARPALIKSVSQLQKARVVVIKR